MSSYIKFRKVGGGEGPSPVVDVGTAGHADVHEVGDIGLSQVPGLKHLYTFFIVDYIT